MEDELYDIPELDPKELEAARKVAEQDKEYEDYTRGESYRFGDILKEASRNNEDL